MLMGAHPLSGYRFHVSHHYGYARGIAWCWTCGRFTTGIRGGLADPCSAPTAAGLAVRARLAKGSAPVAAMDWPLPPGVGPPPGRLALADAAVPAQYRRVSHRARLGAERR